MPYQSVCYTYLAAAFASLSIPPGGVAQTPDTVGVNGVRNAVAVGDSPDEQVDTKFETLQSTLNSAIFTSYVPHPYGSVDLGGGAGAVGVQIMRVTSTSPRKIAFAVMIQGGGPGYRGGIRRKLDADELPFFLNALDLFLARRPVLMHWRSRDRLLMECVEGCFLVGPNSEKVGFLPEQVPKFRQLLGKIADQLRDLDKKQ